MNLKPSQSDLINLLKGENAHVPTERALEGIKPEDRHVQPMDQIHTIWEELEHLRIAQEDIICYAKDESWVSPEFPGGYWPKPVDRVTDEMWDSSLSAFITDLNDLISIVKESKWDLAEEIPHGEGRTYLRQVFLVAGHNAYHIGQIVQVRKMLGAWQ
ncbi:MAG: hypothetical protein IEMM0008_1732 [bacterium]|nr:MAG: hypothetical protein IEMM0008_1732 [bacterium]